MASSAPLTPFAATLSRTSFSVFTLARSSDGVAFGADFRSRFFRTFTRIVSTLRGCSAFTSRAASSKIEENSASLMEASWSAFGAPAASALRVLSAGFSLNVYRSPSFTYPSGRVIP